MPTQRRKGTKKLARRPRAKARRPSMLVLHLDAEKLRRDGLHFGSITDVVAALGSAAADIHVKDAMDHQSLLGVLAELAARKLRFDAVVVIGHANNEGIRAASDAFLTWEVFAEYLRPFEPRRVLLVACQAGRTTAMEALFARLPALRRIYACPVNARKNLAQVLVGCAPLLLAVKAPRPEQMAIAQAMLWAFTGGQLREWVRTKDRGQPVSVLWDAAAQLADPAVRELHRRYLELFK